MQSQGTGRQALWGFVIAVIVVVVFATRGIWMPQSADGTAPTSQTSSQATDASASASISLDNPSLLPTSVAAGEFVDFSFMLRNTGKLSAQYPYKVSVRWSSGESDVIDANVVTLAAGASKDIAESLKFETAGESAQVTIQVLQGGTQIQFSLPRKN